MSDLPVIGQDPWGNDLNTYLAGLEYRVHELETHPYVFTTAPYQYSNSLPPATGNQVRFDNSDLKLATTVNFRRIDVDGADQVAVFQQLDPGSMLRLSDWNDAAIWQRFRTTTVVDIGEDDATLGVAWETGADAPLVNGKTLVMFLTKLHLIE